MHDCVRRFRSPRRHAVRGLRLLLTDHRPRGATLFLKVEQKPTSQSIGLDSLTHRKQSHTTKTDTDTY